LSDAQLRKLAKGGAVIIKPSQCGKGMSMHMSAAKHKKMMTAMNKGKGMRLSLGQDELGENGVEMEGGKINWKAMGRQIRGGLREAGRFYRKEIRPTLGPALKTLTQKGLDYGTKAAVAGVAALTGQPELLAAAPLASKFVSEKGTKAIGKLTGAYGVKKGKKVSMASDKTTLPKSTATAPPPYRPMLQDNYSGFLNPNHPGMNPRLAQPDNSLPRVSIYGNGLYNTTKGGSALGYTSEGGSALGYGMKGGRVAIAKDVILSGLPNDPILNQRDNSTGTPRYPVSEPNSPSTSFF